MANKVLQIDYDTERDRLTWDGWEIHCGQSLEVLLPDRLGGGTWRHVSFEYNDAGWYMPTNLGSRRSAYGHGRPQPIEQKPVPCRAPAFSCFLYCYKNRYIVK